MATREQIEANRKNAKKSTGPGRTDRTRFNGLKHGLRAEQVVLPGEDRAEFEAEKQAWLDDWRPRTHTRAVLVERAAVASWRLRRAVRAEAARLYEVGADVAHDFDLSRRELVECSLHLLPREPGTALARLRSEASGLDCLIGLWDGLAEAAGPGGWTSRADHHDRLLALLGHPAGSEPKDLEVGRISLALLAAPRPGPAVEAPAAALRGFCTERAAELRRERAGFWDPPVLRQRMVDAACAAVTKEAQLMHRYEMAHEQSLRSSLRQLMALERSGADLPEEPESAPEAVAAPAEAVAGASAGEAVPEKSVSTSDQKLTYGELASVGAAAPAEVRSGPSPVSPGRPGRPIGADPGPKLAPTRS